MEMNKKIIIPAVLALVLVSAVLAWHNSPQKQLERAEREMSEARTERQLAKAEKKMQKAIKRGAKVEVKGWVNDEISRKLLGTTIDN